MSRAAQLGVVRWAVDASAGDRAPSDPPLGALTLHEVRMVLLATGLGGFMAGRVAEHGLRVARDVEAHLAEQRAEIEQRQERFRVLLPGVLGVLARASVPTIPVKGVVLATATWPEPGERPTADIDLVVDPRDRRRAAEALTAAGLTAHATSSTEDVFLAWGDGGVGRRDGESAAHNGKVEVHPGWSEYLHGYAIRDDRVILPRAVDSEWDGAPCRLLPAPALVAHCLGHLSACVIRCEVRGLNVLDVVLGLQALDAAERVELGHLLDRLDPRLTAPGLWLVEHARRAAAHDRGVDVAGQIGRLPRAARDQLLALDPAATLRSLGTRTSWSWRSAWTVTMRERAGVARQMVAPPAEELRRADAGGSLVALHARRWRAAVRRAVPGRSERSGGISG